MCVCTSDTSSFPGVGDFRELKEDVGCKQQAPI